MNASKEQFAVHDESLERLICRCLDGEASAAQEAELERLIGENREARELYEEYRHNDLLARQALQHAFGSSMAASSQPSGWRAATNRSFWLTAGTAALSAAALVVIALHPGWRTSSLPDPAATGPSSRRTAELPPLENWSRTATGSGVNPRAGFVPEYEFVDYQPHQRVQQLRRDVIGVRSADGQRIFLYERNLPSVTSAPVVGDF